VPALSTRAIWNMAGTFVAARSEARSILEFPGIVPLDLVSAYAVQDRALSLTKRRIGGWKVGVIRPEFRDRFRAERLAGPIFTDAIVKALPGNAVEAPIFEGGFAALEAEFVITLGRDLSSTTAALTIDDVTSAVASLRGAVELASSPLATISDLGPGAVIADHGNNAGAVIGPEIPDWRSRPNETIESRVFIDGEPVGPGSAACVPGGPLAALAFLARHLMTRGRMLLAEDIILTGATTGVHNVKPGSLARVEFPGSGTIDIHVIAAVPAVLASW
jgi:2-keto-4-pentenoate hydratase